LAGGEAQVVNHPPSKCEALISRSSTGKKKGRKKERERKEIYLTHSYGGPTAWHGTNIFLTSGEGLCALYHGRETGKGKQACAEENLREGARIASH
jgi:hypothetical protein